LAIETNLRIVQPGDDLEIIVRHARISGPDLTTDLLEKACGALRYRRHLAAVVVRGSVPGIVVATDRPVPDVHLAQEEWEIDISDAGEESRHLSLREAQGSVLLPKLIERALQSQLATRRDLWTLETSRIWYEETPICTQDGIAVCRRYEVAAMIIDGAGVGVACDIGTGFFTTEPVSYFFEPSLPKAEAERRAQRFARLTGRQTGQKGTLVYDSGPSRVKCYFEQAPLGVTCATTGKFRVKGRTFESLADYYRQTRPELGDLDEIPAARVSFGGLGRPKWVAANRLRVRVMNDNLPCSLNTIDKIPPAQRRQLVQAFWNRLGSRPFGHVATGVSNEFWRPIPDRIHHFRAGELQFERANLSPPTAMTPDRLRSHYRDRNRFLQEHGCYDVPAVVDRTLFVAYPRRIGEAICQRFVTDMVAAVTRLTGCQFSAEAVPYQSLAEGIEQLRRRARSGTALFVLDAEPTSYHEVAFQLQGWRVKRLTERTLVEHHAALDGRQGEAAHKARSRWEQFIRMNTLDLIQQIDIVPWRLDQTGVYEAQLAIDVGHDRRHFALSLMIARLGNTTPSFKIVTKVQVKPDHKQEAINARFLSDQIVAIFDAALAHQFDPVSSLLILRDGRSSGREPEGIETGLRQLRDRGFLTHEARVDVVEVHKQSLKYLRFWDVDANGTVINPVEGTAVQLSANTILLATTGQATVRQGTAEPLMLVADGRCANVTQPAEAVFAGAQLNWSSPSVAQRLPLALKRTDEELRNRADQEIRRIR
jgi:hypothetical protein